MKKMEFEEALSDDKENLPVNLGGEDDAYF
jgi:hypothetical protein